MFPDFFNLPIFKRILINFILHLNIHFSKKSCAEDVFETPCMVLLIKRPFIALWIFKKCNIFFFNCRVEIVDCSFIMHMYHIDSTARFTVLPLIAIV